jgi:TetR/AcrR family acrAB operon transcriptional repressor
MNVCKKHGWQLMRKTKGEAEATRKKIIEAAIEEFKSKGYETTRLEDIAEKTGLTRGAIYWHFNNKMDILTTLLNEMLAKFEDMATVFNEREGTAVEKLRHLLVEIFVCHNLDKQLRDTFWVLISEIKNLLSLEEVHRAGAKLREKYIQLILKIVQDGMKDGEFRDDIDPYDIVWSTFFLIKGTITIDIIGQQLYPVTEKAETLVDIFLNGIVQK